MQPTPKPELAPRIAGTPELKKLGIMVPIVLMVTSACALRDYEYLGAARGLTSQDGGHAGGTLTPKGRGGGEGSGRTAGGAAAATTIATGAGGLEATLSSRLLTATNPTGIGGAGELGGTSPAGSSGTTQTPQGGRGVGGGAGGTRASATFVSGTSGQATGCRSTGAGTTVGANGASSNRGSASSVGGSTGGRPAGTTEAGTGGAVSAAGGSSAATSATGVTPCAGCARLDVPFTTPGQRARYYLKFLPWATVNAYSGSTMTSAGTMKIRAHVHAMGNTQYQMLIQQDSGNYVLCFSPVTELPLGITSSWVTLEWSLGSCASDSSIGRLGLDLITSSSEVAPGNTSMLIDSIWIEVSGTIVVGPFDFSTASSVNASAVANDWAQTNGVLYLRPSTVAPASTPPSGTTISWQGPG